MRRRFAGTAAGRIAGRTAGAIVLGLLQCDGLGFAAGQPRDCGEYPQASRLAPTAYRFCPVRTAKQANSLVVEVIDRVERHPEVDRPARGVAAIEQPTARPGIVYPQAEIDPRLGGRPHRGEGPPGREQRGVGLPRLDINLTDGCTAREDRIEDRPQGLAVGVLRLDEVVGRGEQVVRVAEGLHHEQHLLVAGDIALGQPGPERLLVPGALARGDRVVPPADVVASLADQSVFDRRPHFLPRLGHGADSRTTG